MRLHRRRWPLPFLASLTLLYGCTFVSEQLGITPEDSDGSARSEEELLERGVTALAAGSYDVASDRLGRLAARCEAGHAGRRAVHLLATAALDPRNPAASVDTAAGLAAHVLALPGTAPDERITAETLYLLALDRGARQLDSDSLRAAFLPPLAPRYTDCDADVAGETTDTSDTR